MTGGRRHGHGRSSDGGLERFRKVTRACGYNGASPDVNGIVGTTCAEIMMRDRSRDARTGPQRALERHERQTGGIGADPRPRWPSSEKRKLCRPFPMLACSPAVLTAQAAWVCRSPQTSGLHECRHTFASLMIAAGVNVKALQVFMGHASITVTMDLDGHLMPGSENEAAALLDAYLTNAIDLARTAEIENRGANLGQLNSPSRGLEGSS
jgi:hypothetical protein